MLILKNFLDFAGLSAYDNKIKQIINSKVAKIKMNNNTLTPDSSGEINLGNIATTSVASDSADGLMSKEDYTRLKNVAAGAEVNVQSDWNESDTSSDAFIKNKPTLGTAASRNATNQISAGSTALPEAGAVKTALDSKEKSGVAETLVKDTVGWTGKNQVKAVYKGYPNTAIQKFTIDNDSESGVFYAIEGQTYVVSSSVALNRCLMAYTDTPDLTTGMPISNITNLGDNTRTWTATWTGWTIWYVYAASSAEVEATLQIELGTEATSYEPYHATVDTVKADKVTNATSGHLAGLDSNGNLTDSGVSPTEDVTVEGNPVTFDSPFEQDAKSVVVSVKPIQDLHGYDHPWVGGAKGNMMDDEYSESYSNVIHVNAGTYYYQGFVTGDSEINTRLEVSKNGTDWTTIATPYSDTDIDVTGWSGGWGGTGIGTATIVITSDFYFRAWKVNGVLTNRRLSFGAIEFTEFYPYSNICPISGIDEVEIGVTGKNELNPTGSGVTQNAILDSQTGETTSNNNYNVSEYMLVESGSKYIYSGVGISSPSAALYDEHKNFVSFISDARSPITIPNGVKYIRIELIKTATNQQFEKGSTPTDYEPYKGSTTTIPLPSTLYDADVDVTNGDADNRFGMVDENANWVFAERSSSYTISSYVTFEDASIKTNGSGMVNFLPINNQGAWNSETPVAQIFFFDGEHGIRIYDNFESLEDFRQKYSGLQFAYELATPTTVSFDPTDVELLEGTNVVSTNAEKVAVTYKAGILATLGDIDDLNDKVKTKFDKKDVAKVEGANASKPYAVGDYMLRSDGFYRVTANIASGAAITSNNTTKVTVGGELANKVNNDDSRLSDARMPSNNSLLLHNSGNEGYISGTKYFMNGNIAMAVDQFSASNTYEVGSYTVYQGQLYKCTVRHFESDWDSSHFAISNNIIVANGTIAAGTYETIGSDYAENFETLENCPVCRFVTLDGEKIRLAQPNDYILGVTSESPSVIGDSMKQGISVGLLGKLWVEHDGSAEINGYVISGENGIAIKSDKGYRVMAVDGNKCKVLVK